MTHIGPCLKWILVICHNGQVLVVKVDESKKRRVPLKINRLM